AHAPGRRRHRLRVRLGLPAVHGRDAVVHRDGRRTAVRRRGRPPGAAAWRALRRTRQPAPHGGGRTDVLRCRARGRSKRMSDLETVRYRREDAVAVITIFRPDAMNSFNTALRRDLLTAFRRAAGDDSVRVVVLTGEGRAFSAGADLKDIENPKPVSEILQEEYRPILECIASMPQPVIAAVNGSAAGIGMSFVLACDLVVMAENASLMSAFSRSDERRVGKEWRGRGWPE